MNDDKEHTAKLKNDVWLKKDRKLFGFIPMYGMIGKTNMTGKDMVEKSPWYFHIDENFKGKMYENVTSGIYEPTDRWGRKKGYKCMINLSKAIRFNYDGQEIPIVIGYDLEPAGYPITPKADAEMISKSFKIIAANEKEWNELSGIWSSFLKNYKEILYLIGGLIGIVIAAIWLWGTFDLGTVFTSKEVVEQTANAAANIPTPVILK